MRDTQLNKDQLVISPDSVSDDAELFRKIKPPMAANEALIEASRCLFCHDAPCIKACPAEIDIPMFIRQIAGEHPMGAAKTIFAQNILGRSCAYVCPTQVLCEGACVYHHLNEKPIDIGRLQGFATDLAIERQARFFEPALPSERKVAVIGSGPAGLACAHELTRLGHAVVVFEADKDAGGLNAYGVAPYKYNNTDAAQEVAYIAGVGFEIRTETKVITDRRQMDGRKNCVLLTDLEKEFDAIFLGTGLGKSKRLGIPGEDLDGIWGATELIHQIRTQGAQMQIGRQVIVVGAGNTAIDAAVESAMLGAQVTVVYRRRPEEQSAYAFEKDHACLHGVQFMYLASPMKFLGETQVQGVLCVKNEVVVNATTGQSEIKPIPSSEFVIACDMLVIATGQEKQTDFYHGIPRVRVDEGKIVVNAQYQTTNPQYFAGGDCVNGGREVVHAATHGRDAARGIDAYLKTQPVKAN